MMAPTTTNYAAIQEDEIQALRSIYMDDFVEETQAGVWNKKGDRAFRIKLRPSGDEDERGLTLIVSLPPTYPKTEPRLRLECGLNLRQKSRAEAQDILKKRPKTLIDSVMIFDIASTLQDVLGESPLNVPTLEEERATREQSARILAMEAEQNQKEKELEAQREEEMLLRELVKQRASRHEKRENKSLDVSSMVGVGGDLPGVLAFERISYSIKDPNGGGTITINSVNSRVKYRQGPVCDVFTVQPFRHIEGEDIREDVPFLALKECTVWPLDGDEPTMRRAIQNFESKMEFHVGLKPHQSIMKPLNFRIQRQIDRPGSGWVISILMELGRRQSLREALEVTDKLDVKLIRAWSIRIIEGLQHYHRHGSAHGNIHSGNILLEKGETETGDHRKITIAKLSDGGFQRDLHSLKRGKPPQNWPTAWTAPENISKTFRTDAIPATDIWDFGICFLQMAFGLDVLNDHQSPSTFLEEVALTKSLRALLRQVFNNDAKKRPSAWDLLHFEFFRNDDALLEPVPLLENSAFGVSSLNLVDSQRFHPRRDSHTAGPSSRYSKEFVEEGRLGRGGFGEVFRARNKIDGQPYAIKKIKARSKPALDPVLSEVTVLSRLNHPNVVRYFASWIENSMVQDLSESEFSEDDESFSVTKSGRLPVLPASSRGLDFISSNNVNVTFGNDPNEEDIDGDYSSSDSSDDEYADQALDSFEEPAEQNFNSLEGHSPNNERTLRANQEQTTWTVLYIQMEYCKPEVRISPFRTTPDAQKQYNAVQCEGTAIVLMQDHGLSPERLQSCSSNLSRYLLVLNFYTVPIGL